MPSAKNWRAAAGKAHTAHLWHFARKLWQPDLQPEQVSAYFVIDDNDFPAGTAERAVVTTAIATWNLQTFAPLVDRTDEGDYVRFREAAANLHSLVGRQGGEQGVYCDIGRSRQRLISDQLSKAAPALECDRRRHQRRQNSRVPLTQAPTRSAGTSPPTHPDAKPHPDPPVPPASRHGTRANRRPAPHRADA